MKKRCLNRKGYFFLIDSMLALGVLAIGIFLIFGLYIKSPSKQEVTILSEDIMDFFATNKIKDIDNDYAGLGGELWNDGKITNAENTLLQQTAQFYEIYEINKESDPVLADEYLDIAKTFIEKLTSNSLPPQYLFEFWMEDQLLYPQPPLSPKHSNSKSATEVLIPSKKIVYGFSDIETGEMFGPYNVEVLVWQQSD